MNRRDLLKSVVGGLLALVGVKPIKPKYGLPPLTNVVLPVTALPQKGTLLIMEEEVHMSPELLLQYKNYMEGSQRYLVFAGFSVKTLTNER